MNRSTCMQMWFNFRAPTIYLYSGFPNFTICFIDANSNFGVSFFSKILIPLISALSCLLLFDDEEEEAYLVVLFEIQFFFGRKQDGIVGDKLLKKSLLLWLRRSKYLYIYVAVYLRTFWLGKLPFLLFIQLYHNYFPHLRHCCSIQFLW